MKVANQDKFISLIAQKTGLPEAKIEQSIKIEDFYPSGEAYEGKKLVGALDKLCKYNTDIDLVVETKPTSFVDLTEINPGFTGSEMEAQDKFYRALKSVHEDEVEDNYVLPSKVEDLGDGFLIIAFNDNKLWNSTTQDGSMVTDFMNNKPRSFLFVDTTPGQQGMRTFLAEAVL